MTTPLRPAIAALTIVLLTAAPGAGQQPPPGGSDRRSYPVECSLPLVMSVRAFLVKLRLELKPGEDQRAAFDEFDTAVNKAVETVGALCRSADFSAPTARLQTALAQIAESLRTIEALQPAAVKFYATLSDAQKAQLGSFDRWFDRASSLLSEWALNSKVPSRSDGRLGDDPPDLNSDDRREHRWRDQENLGRLWRE